MNPPDPTNPQEHLLSELRASEARFRLLFNANPDGVFALGMDGRFILANAACEAITGYSAQELEHKSFLEVTAPDYLQQTTQSFERRVNTRQPGIIDTLETAVIRKDGSRVDLWVTGELVILEDGTPAVYCTARDITDRKAAQRALAQSEQRLKLALESGRMGTWEWNVATDHVEWSEGHYTLLGYDPGSVVASLEMFRQRVHPEDRPAQEKELADSMREKREYHAEFRVIWPDGQVHWLEARGRYRFDSSGAAKRMYGVLMDCDERKANEAALRETEARFRIMADGAPIMIWVTDAQGKTLFINLACREFFGTTMEMVERGQWEPMLHPEDAPGYLRACSETLEQQRPYQAEVRALRHDGVWRWIETHGQPRFSEENEFLGFVGCGLDITDHKNFENQLETLVEERTRSLNQVTNQLNSVCYSIAHDLKAPLRAQISFATLLLSERGDALDEIGRNYINRIIQAAERQSVLVSDLLAHMSVSRTDAPLEVVNLSEVCSQVCIDTRADAAAANASIDCSRVEGAVWANADSLRLVFTHLLSNALKFVGPGQRPQVTSWSETSGHRVRIWVEDKGIGIPSEYSDKVFGLFQKLHSSRAYPGTGVGLAIVRQAVERMGGKVGFDSEPGKGTRFWVELRKADLPARLGSS